MDPDPGGPKTCGSCGSGFQSRSPTPPPTRYIMKVPRWRTPCAWGRPSRPRGCRRAPSPSWPAGSEWAGRWGWWTGPRTPLLLSPPPAHVTSLLSVLWFRTFWPEAEILDEIQTKVLRVFLLAIHSHLYSIASRFLFLQTHATSNSFNRFYTVKKGGKPYRKPYRYPLPYDLKNQYRNLMSENSQDYDQKPQWNCTFIDWASGPGLELSFWIRIRDLIHTLLTLLYEQFVKMFAYCKVVKSLEKKFIQSFENPETEWSGKTCTAWFNKGRLYN